MNSTSASSSEFPITPEPGQRLDRTLADALPDLSRSRLKALILGGHVRSAAATITDPSYRVKPGDRFTVTVPPPAEMPLEGQDITLAILHEDESLLVIDKPAGLVVHPGAGRADGTLVNALIAHCGDSLSGIGGVRRPGIVHRLDKDTSGLIVVAKTDAAHAALALQFETRSIDRAYLALVWGAPLPPAGEIEGNIGRSNRDRKKMAVVPAGRGKPALTRYRTLARAGSAASLIECRLATGRTHQIRVHLAHIGHPVIGDPVYGRVTRARLEALPEAARDAVRRLHRQALHAIALGFDHPVTGKRLRFTGTLPPDLALVVQKLGLEGLNLAKFVL